jgi:putative CocE/NonD family hydrolase
MALAGCVDTLRGAVYLPQPPDPVPGEPFRLNGTDLLLNRPYEHSVVTIPGSDGTPLSGDVWRPTDNATAPVVLILSPGFGAIKGDGNVPAPNTLASKTLSEFVRRGYAVALVDVRGTRASEGCMVLGGTPEQKDAAAVVEWLATQPWSTGKVGMIGQGYDGYEALMAAAQHPPHLAAIVPISPFTDVYHVVAKGGAKLAGSENFAADETILSPLGLDRAPSAPGNQSDPRIVRAPDSACVVEGNANADDPSGQYSAWMKERDLRSLAANATVPMLFAAGLVDEVAKPDHIDPFLNAYGGPKRAFLWQAAHTIPSGNTGRSTDVWWTAVVRWFDYHLYGHENNVTQTYGAFEVQDSAGRWRNETAWPPADATMREFPLGVDSGLAQVSGDPTSRLALAGSTWREDPTEDGGPLGARSMIPAQGSTASRLVFRTQPLTEDLHLAGRPVVHTRLSTDRPNALVVTRLYEIREDGAWVLVNRGVQSVLFRDALDVPAPAIPGVPYELDAKMEPDDFVFRAGERIGIVLSGADASYVNPSPFGATTTLLEGELRLPVISERAPFAVSWGGSQPTWRGPHAWGELP